MTTTKKQTTEYIVCVLTKDYGWCLQCVAGTNKEWADKVCAEYAEKNPTKQYRVEATIKEDNWWNDPFLAK